MPEDLRTWVAVYAAVVSTLTAAWTFGKDLIAGRRRTRLLLGFDSSVQIGDRLVSVSMELRVTNASYSRAIEIVSVDFDTLRWILPVDDGVRPATTEQAVLPVLLSPAQSVRIPIYLSSDRFDQFSLMRHMVVKDSTGRIHKLSRRQLKSAKDLLKDLIRRASTGAPFNLSVTRRLPDE